MAKQAARRPSGFDYGYRPTSYFKNLDPHTVVVASILGEERRKDVKARIESGDFDRTVWGEWITESRLDDDIRTMLGRGHPSLMGGEYLPPLEDDEIEIARVVCASVTQDVTSIRARRCGKRIGYAIVDDNEYTYTVSRLSSTKPLTLGQLIALIDRSHVTRDEYADGGLVYSTLRLNMDGGSDVDGMRRFIRVESAFYPEVRSYYVYAIPRFLEERYPPEEVDEDEAEVMN